LFYIALRRPAIPREQWTVDLDTHLKWMEEMHRTGKILLSGPSPDRTLGIYLVKAESRAEAEQIAGGDPYTAAGHSTFELIEWNIHQAFGIGPFSSSGLGLRN
jgi:uncharacterized protein YciI